MSDDCRLGPASRVAQWQPIEQGRVMAPKRFAGDASNRLPKGKKEPYRLWFEYLKLALRIPEIRVDRSLYQPWGDVEGEDFDKWWPKNWSALFAIDAPTRVLTTLSKQTRALKDPTVVLLRVSLTETKKRRLQDVTDALSAVPLSPNLNSKARKSPLFTLSTKRSMNCSRRFAECSDFISSTRRTTETLRRPQSRILTGPAIGTKKFGASDGSDHSSTNPPS